MIAVTVESDENDRPYAVCVTDSRGHSHHFVRSDDCAERALRAAQDGRALGFEHGVGSVARDTAPRPVRDA